MYGEECDCGKVAAEITPRPRILIMLLLLTTIIRPRGIFSRDKPTPTHIVIHIG